MRPVLKWARTFKYIASMRQKNKPSNFPVVGVVDSLPALEKARRLHGGAVDFLEWRADSLPADMPIPKSRFPWILTVRDPREGGGRQLRLERRREIFTSLLPRAHSVDIELRSVVPLAGVVESARAGRIRVIASFHDFRRTPSVAKLRDLSRRAHDAGADVLKIAAVTSSPSDVARLLALFDFSPLPPAVMGMGPLGPGSRVLFAQCGSVLNYGWLHRPVVPGQWPAVELKRILSAF